MQVKNKPILNKIAINTLKYLVVAMASATVMPMGQADTKIDANPIRKIGDLEVYKPPEGGRATITMMLDTSGSMGNLVDSGSDSISDDYGGQSCGRNVSDITLTPTATNPFLKNLSFTDESGAIINSVKNADGTITDTSKGISLTYRGCPNLTENKTWIDPITGATGTYPHPYFDRLSRLKEALIGLLADGKKLASKHKLGMGNFSANGDGAHGRVMVPAAELTPAQRLRLINYVKSLTAYNGTPSAQAYAEAGAYMMGTSTSDTVNDTRVIEKGYAKYYNGKYYLYQCKTNAINPTNYGDGLKWYSCNSTYNNATVVDYNYLQSLNFNLIGNPNYKISDGSSAYYYGTKTTGQWPINNYSGMGLSDNSTKKSDLTAYQSPINPGQCDGYGVYFLTDGEPNSSSSSISSTLMAKSLNQSAMSCSGSLTNSTSDSAWDCIGAYAKQLNNASNPSGQEIKTAAVGFGSTFDSMKNYTRVIQVPDGDKRVDKTIIDCSKASTRDGYNLCKLSETKDVNGKSGGYGEGGFTATSDPTVLAQSVQDFLKSLTLTINAAPSGTIVIPDDPYKVDSQLAVAYIPTVESQLAKETEYKTIWPGNMKKYSLNNGTLFGKNNIRLFLDSSGSLNPVAQDLWSDKDYTDINNNLINDSASAGGFYAQLATPNSGLSSLRTLYVEDTNPADATKTTIRKFGVDSSGKVILDGKPLSSSNTFKDTATYTEANIRYLLNFLGFNNLPDIKVLAKDMTLTKPTDAIKVLGATIHSAPASVSYSATLDSDGRVTDNRDDYVLFGSMDGALHMVNADNYGSGNGGKEVFSFIPKQILLNQASALQQGSTQSVARTPKFGIDAPWLVTADYRYDNASNRVAVDTRTVGTSQKGVYAYGGLRMGGEAIYGLNLTTANSAAPTMMFSLTPALSDFKRMGQIWSKPTKAKIKTSSSDKGTDVLIFGGGYDTCYENEGFQVGITDTTFATDVKGQTCSGKAEAQGDAVYIVNAQTGALIWSASSSSGSTTVPTMKNSIVGSITALDRNNDGFMDHLYFADLGGQVFRADFTNANSTGGSFANTRVTRILKPAFTASTELKYNHRFYERPIVSFYRNPKSNRLFALVNVISGDRSSPLSKMRDNNTYADRLYGIMDSDVTLPDTTLFASGFKPTIIDLADINFAFLPTAIGAGSGNGFEFTKPQKQVVMDTMDLGTVRGWVYPLIRFDGYYNVKYSKGVGKSEVIASKLYTSVYNPDMNYGKADSCKAKIAGGTERELYCLPYGICLDDSSKSGTAGFIRAGQGIQELTLGPRSSELTSQKLLIGTRTIDEQGKDIRVDFNGDTDKQLANDADNTTGNGLTQKDVVEPRGDATAGLDLIDPRYKLSPNTWFEVNK